MKKLKGEYAKIINRFDKRKERLRRQNEDGLCMFRFYAHSLHCHQNLIDAAYEAVVEFLTSHMKGVNTNGN